MNDMDVIHKKGILMLLFAVIVPMVVSAQEIIVKDVIMAKGEQLSTVESQKVPLYEELQKIEHKYDVQIFYMSKAVNGKYVHKAETHLDQEGAEPWLNSMLEPLNMKFRKLAESSYVVMEKKSVDQPKVLETVEGTITDAQTDDVLPGVNIAIKGTSSGTSSNADGEFSLNVPSLSDTLIFSFIGYETTEVPIQGRTQIDVVMQPTTITGEELVVVGYGTQRKESIVAGVSTVSEQDLERAGDVPNLGMALTGKLPGVVTVSSTGLPGDEDPQIFIRGQSTWQDSSPLILVDGIERPISNVDMSSVESVTVLKDASATAVYGVRGANGVILIQTKSGYEGQVEISGSFKSTLKAPSRLPSIKDAYETLKLRNKAIEYELTAPGANWGEYYNPDFVDHYQKPQTPEEQVRYANVDWDNVLFRDVTQSYDANLNVRGGSEFVNFFASANYLNEGDLFKEFENNRGYQPGFGFQRLNARTNLDFQISPSTELKAKISGSYGVRKRPWGFSGGDYGFWVAAYSASPTQYLPRYPDGSYGFNPNETGGSSNSLQTLALSGIERSTNTQLTTNFELDQDLDMLVEGLNFNGQIAVDNTFIEASRGINDLFNAARNKYVNPISGEVTYEPLYDSGTRFDFQSGELWSTDGGSVQNGATYRRVYYQLQLNYDFTLGEKHNFSEMGLFNRTQNATGSIIPHARENWVFRTTYNYDQRYILEYNGSYNGSEKFDEDFRFGFFSSGGIGWNIHNENFMSSLDFLDNLKLRASYGKIGDDNTTGRWLYRTEWAYGGQAPLGTRGWFAPESPYTWYKVESLGNSDVHWATVTKANIGLDFGFLDGLVSGTVDIFRDRREDIIISSNDRAIPSYFGQTAPAANLGEVKNQGYEITLNLDHRFGNGLRLWTEMNYTHAQNEVIERDDPELLPEYQKQEGYAVGQARSHIDNGFYDSWDELYATTPFNTNDASKLPGGKYIVDFNSDGVIDSQDSVPYGYSGTPQNTYNATIGFDWAGFSGFVQFYAVNNVNRWINFGSLGGNELAYTVDGGYWSMDNTGAETVMPRWNTSTSGYSDGSGWMYDGSYLRLKNAQIGYTFDSNSGVAKSLGVSSLRIYANGNNLLVWTDMPDDRESNFAGGGVPSQGAYPTVKRYNFGVNINF
ncbi:TonB-dependent receptor [Aliifodinibius sp. S!AR15-10]|uniref:SusC/RagA family TonB-linked outer membrane protein n=1 Tax=Aliifodinibius sp. S!AR15-10 TaxID=2950437 RepID=UPI0028650FA5|nr:TonB-dependent receptor [Aliifodinibius sp. S!AR15-10]MDR8393363.1 TonB-dependent receptor [Aliifodinibius sp. S!AR15-10]